MDSILSRLLIALVIVGASVAAYWAVNRLLLRRVRERRAGLESFRPGAPGVLYFTSPDCRPCHTVQRPALYGLKEALGGKFQLIEIDVTERPDLADYWGVLSLPTTFVIDPNGQPRRVNHGVTARAKILQQLADISGAWLSPAEFRAASGSARLASQTEE